MPYLIIGVTIGLLLASVMSLLAGQMALAVIELLPALFILFAKFFPGNFALRGLATPISPVARPGMRKSRLRLEKALFSGKLFILFLGTFMLLGLEGVRVVSCSRACSMQLLFGLVVTRRLSL